MANFYVRINSKLTKEGKKMREYRRRPKVNYLNLAVLIGIIVLLLITLFFGVKMLLSMFGGGTDISKTNKHVGTYKIEKSKKLTFVNLNTGNEKLDNILKTNFQNAIKGLDENKKSIYDCSTSNVLNTFVNVSCTLTTEGNKVSENSVTFHKNLNEVVTYDMIFRSNPYYLKDLFPNVDLNSINKEKITLDNEKVYIGEEKNKLTIPFSGNEKLFKAGNGIPSLFKKDPIERVVLDDKPSDKMIAFTFDDGPLNQNHVKIREIFNKYKIPATFYVIGELVDRNPDVILQTFKDGHSIDSHTYTHPGLANYNLTTIGEQKVREEYEKTNDAIFKIIGKDPTTTRPPGGFIDDKTAKFTNLTQVLWDVDSQDWMYKFNTEKVYRNVRDYVRPGAIVLFHDLYDSTVAAVERIVPELINEGYKFVSVDTILASR